MKPEFARIAHIHPLNNQMNIHAIADEIIWMLHHSIPGASAPAALQSWQQESNVKISPEKTAQVLAFIANKNNGLA